MDKGCRGSGNVFNFRCKMVTNECTVAAMAFGDDVERKVQDAELVRLDVHKEAIHL